MPFVRLSPDCAPSVMRLILFIHWPFVIFRIHKTHKDIWLKSFIQPRHTVAKSEIFTTGKIVKSQTSNVNGKTMRSAHRSHKDAQSATITYTYTHTLTRRVEKKTIPKEKLCCSSESIWNMYKADVYAYYVCEKSHTCVRLDPLFVGCNFVWSKPYAFFATQ